MLGSSYTLLFHEVKCLLNSFKFFVLLITVLLVSLIIGYVQVKNYHSRFENYEQECLKDSKKLKNIEVYSDLIIPINIPPNPLSIFSMGVDNKTGNKINISIFELPDFNKSTADENVFLPIFHNIDIIDLLGIILSAFIILLFSDSISNEKEQGTMKLIFSNPIRKVDFFISKYIASLFLIFSTLSLMFILTIFQLLFNSIPLTQNEIIRILMLFMSTLFFSSIFILVSLLISANAKTSSVALLTGLSLWLVIALVYPNMVDILVNKIYKIPSKESVESYIAQKNQSFYSIYLDWERDNSGDKGFIYSYYRGNRFFPLYIGQTSEGAILQQERKISELLPIYFDNTKLIMDIKYDWYLKNSRRNRIIRIIQNASPSSLMKNISEELCKTNGDYRNDFILKEAISFRNNEYLKYLKNSNAFSRKFFYSSSIPEKEMDSIVLPQFDLKDSVRIPIGIIYLLAFNLGLILISIYMYKYKVHSN